MVDVCLIYKCTLSFCELSNNQTKMSKLVTVKRSEVSSSPAMHGRCHSYNCIITIASTIWLQCFFFSKLNLPQTKSIFKNMIVRSPNIIYARKFLFSRDIFIWGQCVDSFEQIRWHWSLNYLYMYERVLISN